MLQADIPMGELLSIVNIHERRQRVEQRCIFVAGPEKSHELSAKFHLVS